MNVDVVKPKVEFDRLITTIMEIFGCCATSMFLPSIDIAVPPLQMHTQFKRHNHNIRVRYAARLPIVLWFLFVVSCQL